MEINKHKKLLYMVVGVVILALVGAIIIKNSSHVRKTSEMEEQSVQDELVSDKEKIELASDTIPEEELFDTTAQDEKTGNTITNKNDKPVNSEKPEENDKPDNLDKPEELGKNDKPNDSDNSKEPEKNDNPDNPEKPEDNDESNGSESVHNELTEAKDDSNKTWGKFY